MVNINLSTGEKYKFPDKWSDVKLEQFQEINKLTTAEDIGEQVSLISILSGIPKEVILDLPYNEYAKLLTLCKFRNDTVDTKPELTFELDGIEYGYELEISTMSTGCFIDLDYLSKSENLIDQMHLFMAIFYRPIIKRTKSGYTIEKYNAETLIDRAELFKEKMTMEKVFSALNFLMALGIACSDYMLTCSYQMITPKSPVKSKKFNLFQTVKRKVKGIS